VLGGVWCVGCVWWGVVKEEYEYSHIKLTVRSSAIDLERLKKRMLNL